MTKTETVPEKLHRRGLPLSKGEYHLVVHIWVKNSSGEFFITKRSQNKTPFPGQMGMYGRFRAGRRGQRVRRSAGNAGRNRRSITPKPPAAVLSPIAKRTGSATYGCFRPTFPYRASGSRPRKPSTACGQIAGRFWIGSKAEISVPMIISSTCYPSFKSGYTAMPSPAFPASTQHWQGLWKAGIRRFRRKTADISGSAVFPFVKTARISACEKMISRSFGSAFRMLLSEEWFTSQEAMTSQSAIPFSSRNCFFSSTLLRNRASHHGRRDLPKPILRMSIVKTGVPGSYRPEHFLKSGCGSSGRIPEQRDGQQT